VVTGLHVGNVVSDSLDDTGAFVSHDGGQLGLPRGIHKVQVAVAQASVNDLQ
jgi:hypothetical protein